MVHAHSLASKIAPEKPVVSAGAGEFVVQAFTSPNSFFQNQVTDHGKDYNLGMGAQSLNWCARPNVFHETSALPETSFFDANDAAWETSVFDENDAAPETSVFNEKSNGPEKSFFNENGATPETNTGSMTERPIQISAIGGHPFRRLVYKQKLTIFSTSLYEINQALGVKEKPKKELDLKTYIPTEYHKFLPLFSEALAKNLPPHRPYDHKIPLREGFMPPFGPLYSMSITELETLKEWLEENLSKGFIRASSSPVA